MTSEIVIYCSGGPTCTMEHATTPLRTRLGVVGKILVRSEGLFNAVRFGESGCGGLRARRHRHRPVVLGRMGFQADHKVVRDLSRPKDAPAKCSHLISSRELEIETGHGNEATVTRVRGRPDGDTLCPGLTKGRLLLYDSTKKQIIPGADQHGSINYTSKSLSRTANVHQNRNLNVARLVLLVCLER